MLFIVVMYNVALQVT